MAQQRKLFLGARLKRLRRERGLNQSQMADQLGISGSYLNHLERNQRPVTAGILLRDRKSTRLNSSHVEISYAVFCLKKKKKNKSNRKKVKQKNKNNIT